jgi:hypothetical protein
MDQNVYESHVLQIKLKQEELNELISNLPNPTNLTPLTDEAKVGASTLPTFSGTIWVLLITNLVLFFLEAIFFFNYDYAYKLEYISTFLIVTGVLFETQKFQTRFYNFLRGIGPEILIFGLFLELMHVSMKVHPNNLGVTFYTGFGVMIIVSGIVGLKSFRFASKN